jgi:patatin-related protein
MLAGNLLALAHPDAGVKAREVRLGLVLYGGVSLAVYINGVTHEFFRAVRGQGVYRLLKALTDSDIVVDVVSGTSAGGINGILLAYSLCGNKDFAGGSRLWRAYGGIQNLLRSPELDPAHCVSLLDSEGYYQPRLEEAFATLPDYQAEPGEDTSEFDELDLFITGTDVDGNLRTEFDDAGHPIDIKDHRTLFLLKHRRGRKEPFFSKPGERATLEALAKLARITSCFPAAFAPVLVSKPEPGSASADARLQEWGALGKESCFLDGGVLDNKPFTSTIKAIFSRSANREVKRILFYVEPDPERFASRATATQPNFLQAILASLLSIPSYQSIADDLKLLAAHNDKVLQYNRLVGKLDSCPRPARPGPPHMTVAPPAAMAALATARRVYSRSRLIALSGRVIQGLLRTDARDVLIPNRYRQRAAELVQVLDRLFEQLPEKDAEKLFRDLDVYYRLRRLYRVVYLIYELLYAGLPAATRGSGGGDEEITVEQAARCRALWQALNRQIELYEIVQASMESLIDEAPFPWKDRPPEEVWLLVQAALYRLLDPTAEPAGVISQGLLEDFLRGRSDSWLPQARLCELNAAFKDRARQIAGELRSGTLIAIPVTGGQTVLVLWESFERALLDHYLPRTQDDPVRRAYDHFLELDRSLYPLEVSSGLREKDIIETIRISPRDAIRGFSRVDCNEKVAGTALHHFGGFFKRSWRANDMLWGRLDGLCQLFESLLDRERLEQIVAHGPWRARLRERFFKSAAGDAPAQFTDALDPQKLFPKAGAPSHRVLQQWLRDLLGDNSAARQQALGEFPDKLDLLVEAAQLEVLAAEVPRVIGDAISEQAEWNRFQVARPARRPAKFDPQPRTAPAMLPWVFQSPKGNIDPFVVATAAEEAKKRLQTDPGGIDPSSPAATALGTFFREAYRVGSERWDRDIPNLVLLQILATALLVLRNCVLNLFGPLAPAVRRNLLYKLGVDYPLRAFYATVLIARRDPGWLLVLFFGTGLLSVFALLVAVGWRDEIIFTPTGLQLRWLTAFVIVPGGILLGELLFLLRYRGGFGWGRAAAFLLVAAGGGVLLLVGKRTGVSSDSNSGQVAELLLFYVAPGIILFGQGIYVFWLFVLWVVGPSGRRAR